MNLANSGGGGIEDRGTAGTGPFAEHPLFGRVKFRTMELGTRPDEQVGRTLGVMIERATEDAADPGFRNRVYTRIADPGAADLDKVADAYTHTKGAIRFQRDEEIGAGIAGIADGDLLEVIIRPVDMARYIDQGISRGDCDDFSMYLAAVLTTLDIPCSFATVAADGRAPDQYSHVYVVAYPRDEDGNRVRIPLDASHGQYAGWEVPNRFGKYREWELGGCGFLTMLAAGFGGTMLAAWVIKEIRGIRGRGTA